MIGPVYGKERGDSSTNVRDWEEFGASAYCIGPYCGTARPADHIVEPQDQQNVMTLCISYSNVFAFDERDLGGTDMVKHCVHMGNSISIREIPRRLP